MADALSSISSSATSKPLDRSRFPSYEDDDHHNDGAIIHDIQVIQASPIMMKKYEDRSHQPAMLPKGVAVESSPAVVVGLSPPPPSPPKEELGFFGRMPCITWLFTAYILTGLISVTWLVYCCVRYTRAIPVYSTHPLRYRDTILFAVLSYIALVIIVLNVAVVAMGFKLSTRSHAALQCLLFVGSVSALTPAAFNVAVICLFHRRSPTSDPYLSLVGRCTLDSDLVWSGVIPGCQDSVPWGTWLAVALVRLGVTLTILTGFHWLTWTQALDPEWGTPAHKSMSSAHLVPVSPTKLRKRHPESLRVGPDSVSSLGDPGRNWTASLHGHTAANLTYFPQHLVQQSSSSLSSPPPCWRSDPEVARQDPQAVLHPQRSSTDSSDHQFDAAESRDLNRFASSFRSLVERVTMEAEAASTLGGRGNYSLNSPTSPTSSSGYPHRSYSPPPRRSFSPVSGTSTASVQRSSSVPPPIPPAATHYLNDDSEGEWMRRQLIHAHQIMLLEQADRMQSYEHIMVLGNPVRRMSTIPSIPDPEREPWTPASDVTFNLGIGGGGANVTRSPTGSSAGRKTVATNCRHSSSTLTATPPPAVGRNIAEHASPPRPLSNPQ